LPEPFPDPMGRLTHSRWRCVEFNRVFAALSAGKIERAVKCDRAGVLVAEGLAAMRAMAVSETAATVMASARILISSRGSARKRRAPSIHRNDFAPLSVLREFLKRVYRGKTPENIAIRVQWVGQVSTGQGLEEKNQVNCSSKLLFLAALAGAATVYAQSNPLSTELKQNYTAVKNDTLKAAEKMAEDNYGFKSSGDTRTFAMQIAHIADTQIALCSMAKGEMKRGDAATKTSKADLVAALKASFDYCDSAYDAINDADGTQMVKMFGRDRTKFGVLDFNVIHDNEMYGTIAVMLRQKDIVPPSTADRPMGQGKKKQ
jgi:hypothetical protein